MDYIALQMHSFAVLSDSDTISEEFSILNFRALNIRQAHERPEAMEEASLMMVALNPERVLQGLTQRSISISVKKGISEELPITQSPNVAEKMVRIILSYADYVNRVIWSKEII